VKLRHNGFLPLLAVAVVFTLYDVLVQRRQRHVVDKAERTNQLVSTLFPSNVRDRLLGQNTVHDDVMFQDDNKTVHSNLTAEYLEKTRVAGETGPVDPTNPYETRPIADLFPEATVRKFASLMDTIKVTAVPIFVTLTLLFSVFADIVGFTAWSSVREPTQVRWHSSYISSLQCHVLTFLGFCGFAKGFHTIGDLVPFLRHHRQAPPCVQSRDSR
jgi:hypothetical protein